MLKEIEDEKKVGKSEREGEGGEKTPAEPGPEHRGVSDGHLVRITREKITSPQVVHLKL